MCRSSTLSCGPELYTRSSINYLFNTGTAATNPPEPSSDDVDYSYDGMHYCQSHTDCVHRRALSVPTGIVGTQIQIDL